MAAVAPPPSRNDTWFHGNSNNSNVWFQQSNLKHDPALPMSETQQHLLQAESKLAAARQAPAVHRDTLKALEYDVLAARAALHPDSSQVSETKSAGQGCGPGAPRMAYHTGELVEVMVLPPGETTSEEWRRSVVRSMGCDGKYSLTWTNGEPVRPALATGIEEYHIRPANSHVQRLDMQKDERALAQVEAGSAGSEEISNICLSGSQDKYDDTPEPEKIKQLQALVGQGQRLNDEQINKLKATSESHSDRAYEESRAGDLNWSYESNADAKRILKYLEVYNAALQGKVDRG